jgi:SET domain
MTSVQSSFHRCDDTDRGRHLRASDPIAAGQLIWVERPLFCLQSLPNIQYNRYICYGCKAFVSTPAAMMLWRCQPRYSRSNDDDDDDDDMNDNNNNIGNDDGHNKSSSDTAPVDDDEVERVSSNVADCLPCRNGCGYVYCSTQCELETWRAHHALLCTGDKEEHHPVVQYKQYAVQTNEILLLIAEWWITQHYHQQQQYQQTTDPSRSNPIHNLIHNNSNNSNHPYTDFIMNPWWEVVTADMIQDPQEPGAGFINGQLISIHQQLYEVCTTAAQLFNLALGYSIPPPPQPQPQMEATNVVRATAATTRPPHDVPPITAKDISCRIGAMEQNAMGIRQRSPLSSLSTLMDTSFRRTYHTQFVQCLVETGFLDDTTTTTTEEETAVEAMLTDNGMEKSGDQYTNKEYSLDQIALRLSKLHMNEDFSVYDTYTDPNEDEIQVKPMYGGDGDDLDILFPPLDGTAMYSIACKMNHSCDPNVILLYRRRPGFGKEHPLAAFLVALRDISAGDELTISYIDANAPYQERQKALINYGFICHCHKCRSDKVQISSDVEDVDNDENEEDDDDDDEDVSMDELQEQSIDDEIDGETKLQRRLERLDSSANCSMFGRIPPHCYDPVANFVTQTAHLLLTNHHQHLLTTAPSSGMEQNDATVIMDLLQKCVVGLTQRDYCLCKIVGCDLEATLLGPRNGKGAVAIEWPSAAHRESYYCAVLTACIGYCREYDFISAKNTIEYGLILGLPRECVGSFVDYILVFAGQMLIGPYSVEL